MSAPQTPGPRLLRFISKQDGKKKSLPRSSLSCGKSCARVCTITCVHVCVCFLKCLLNGWENLLAISYVYVAGLFKSEKAPVYRTVWYVGAFFSFFLFKLRRNRKAMATRWQTQAWGTLLVLLATQC